MIWTKTDIGRAEIGARALVHERARRNLLLLIDGVRSQDALLVSVSGIGRGDFDQLARLGLIAELSSSATSAAAPAPATPAPRASAAPTVASMPVLDLIVGEDDPLPSYAQFTARLTQLISKEIGLRGFRMTLAVEKAADLQELQPVAERVLAEIAKRKGDAAATAARHMLYGA